MRALAEALLRRVAGDTIADSILGDVSERRESTRKVFALAMQIAPHRLGVAIKDVVTQGFPGRGVGRELRGSVRSLRKSPWYSLAVIGVVALTGGLTTSGFAIADGVLFKRLPIPEPETLYATAGPNGMTLSYADTDKWQQIAPTASIAMYGRHWVIGAMGQPRPRPIMALLVGQNFFDVLGERPSVGAWTKDDFVPGAPRVRVMISDAMWRSYFGARVDIVGQPFDIAGAQSRSRKPIGPFEVAGVLPRDFVAPVNRATPDMLLPLAVAADMRDSRDAVAGRALVRTKSKTPVLEAAFTIAYGSGGAAAMFKDVDSRDLKLTPIERYLEIWQRGALVNAFAACLVLMLLAVLNVAALNVLRGQQQSHELGIRRAMGASRLDLFRCALFDTAPPVLAGMAIALTIAPWAIAFAMSYLPDGIALLKAPEIDWRVIAFWIALAVFTTVATSVIRTLAVRPATVANATRSGEHSTRLSSRFGAVAGAAQIALAFAITAAGALTMGSLWQQWHVPIGYTMERTWLIDFSHRAQTADERRAVTASMIDQIRSTPNVESVSPVEGGPFLTGTYIGRPALPVPLPPPPYSTTPFWAVGADFFPMLNVPLRAGRVFTREEVEQSAPVVVLTETAAGRIFPAGGAIGSQLDARSVRGAPLVTVIGIVSDMQVGNLGYVDNKGVVFEPAPLSGARVSMFVKVRGPIEPVLAAVYGQPVGVIRALSLKEALTHSSMEPTFRAWLFGAFALAALAIVGVGTFGIIAMSIGRRTRELGIRSALGATQSAIVRLFVREQLAVVLIGIVAGAALSFWGAKFMDAYLYKTKALDPALWSAAGALLFVVAAIAALIPSLHASRIDPLRALRDE